jgi:hypothetical protein
MVSQVPRQQPRLDGAHRCLEPLQVSGAQLPVRREACGAASGRQQQRLQPRA